MPEKSAHSPGRRARLGIEQLEDRTVPSSFGANRGLSIAAGPVLTNNVGNNGPNQYVMGTGPGTVATVNIYGDGGGLLQSFRPFGANFKGGVTVAIGDVNNDGIEDIICGTGAGTIGRVKVFEYTNGGLVTLATIVPFGPNFTGGVNVAAGVVTGANPDPTVTNPDNIVCSVASAGPPAVKVFTWTPTGTFQVRGFLAYAPTYSGGVSLAVGNIDTAADTLDANGNLTGHVFSYAEIITGKAAGSPLLRVWDAQDPTPVLDASYMAFDQTDPANHHGITVAVGDTAGVRGDQIFANLIGGSTVRVFDGQTSAILTTIIALPGSTTKQLSMYVADMTAGAPPDNDFTGTYAVHDLIVVAADGAYHQVPEIWTGGAPAAGFNGHHPAP